MNDKLEKQLQFIIEIDKLKNILRRTKLIHADRYENDAEHSWHLAMMAIILQDHANEPVDLAKVLKMVLIHDIVEIDAGDTFAYDTKGHEDKAEREMQAAERLFGMLPAEQREELMALWQEFEKQESAEARFASSLDRLQPLIHNYMNQGYTWRKFGIHSEQVRTRNQEIAGGSEALWNVALDIIHKSEEAGYLPKSSHKQE